MTDKESLIIGVGVGILAGILLSAYSVTKKYCDICNAYPQKCTTRTVSKNRAKKTY